MNENKEIIRHSGFPLVSIVMPVYQGESTIAQAVQSVLNQTYQHLELIVVNDGSTDGTLDALNRFDDERLHIITKLNEGVSIARNHGLSQASGEYFAFLDADDLWLPDKLEKDMVAMRQAADPVGLFYSWYYAVDEKGRLVNVSFPYPYQGHIQQKVLECEGLLLPSTTMLHRQVFEAVGGFPTDSYHEDRVFFIKATENFPAYPTHARTVIYQQTLSGRCRRILKDFDAALEAELSIVSALKNVLPSEQMEKLHLMQTRNLFYRFLMYNYFESAKRLYPQLNVKLLKQDKKGLLSILSMRTGFNALYWSRVLLQFYMKNVLLLWWQKKRAAASKI